MVAYERRQPMLARFLIGQITGFAIGVWIGGITAEHWPWRTPFFGVAAFFAAAAGHNTLQTHATQMAPERCGTAVAAFASCFFPGQSAGVGIAGRVVGDSGTGWVLAAGAARLLALAWGFNRQRARVLRGGFSAAT